MQHYLVISSNLLLTVKQNTPLSNIDDNMSHDFYIFYYILYLYFSCSPNAERLCFCTLYLVRYSKLYTIFTRLKIQDSYF